MEKVSIIVPVYKSEPYLAKCLDSLLAQSYADIEVLLINDGSPDNSHDICLEYSHRDERIKYYQKKNGGLSDARNYALERANGSWIAFVDSDDYVEREYIEALYRAAKEHKVRIACCGYYRKMPGQTVSVCYERQGLLSAQELWKSVMTGEDIGNFMCNKLFDRQLFDEVRFPVGKKYEDIRVFYRLVGAQKHVAVVQSPLYYYVAHGGSITGNFTSATSEHFMEASEMLAAYIDENHPELAAENAAYRIRMHIDNMNGLSKTGITASDPHFKPSRIYLAQHWKDRVMLNRKYQMFAWFFRWAPCIVVGVQRLRRRCART